MLGFILTLPLPALISAGSIFPELPNQLSFLQSPFSPVFHVPPLFICLNGLPLVGFLSGWKA